MEYLRFKFKSGRYFLILSLLWKLLIWTSLLENTSLHLHWNQGQISSFDWNGADGVLF